MVEHLLSVTRPEAQDAQVSDDLGVKTLQADLQHRRLPLLFDPLQDLDSGLGDDLLDSGRMNPAVDYQLVQRDSSHLAADGVETADDDGFRGVVHYQVDPRRLLKGPDVAALFADDAALELVGRQRQHRDRNLGGLVGGNALYRLGDDLPGPALALVASSKLRLPHLAGNLVAELLLDLAHQDSRGFLPGHVGDPLKLLLLLLIGLFELSLDLVLRLLLIAELALTLAEILGLAVEVLLFLKKALFDLLRLSPVLPGLLFGGGADLDRFLLGFQKLLFGLRFGLGKRLLGFDLQRAAPIALPAAKEQIRHSKAGKKCHH